jgi:NitT/TauT family transport system permease protein
VNRELIFRSLIIAAIVGMLELACRTGAIPPGTMIPPSAMAFALVSLLWSGKVNADISRTLLSVTVAFSFATVVGVAIGATLHSIPRLRRVLDPLLATYYAVPFFIFYPVLIAFFGISPLPIILMGFAFAVVAVVIATMAGLDRVPPVFSKLAKVTHMRPATAAWHLTLPSALPHIFSGVKLAVAYSFVGVLASEFILAPNGVGHAIAYAYNDWDNRTMYALVLFVILVVVAINTALTSVERRLALRRGAR